MKVQDILGHIRSMVMRAITFLATDRTVDLNGKNLRFQYNDIDFLKINTTPGDEEATLKAFNITPDGNISQISAKANDTQAFININAQFNDGVKEVEINGFTDDTTASLTYAADSHTFNGNVIMDNLSFKDNTNFIRMFSPDGSPWILTVDDTGTLVIAADV